MRRLLGLLEAIATASALLLATAACIAFALEGTGRLRTWVIDRLTAEVEPLGLKVDVGAVRARWFEPSIELDAVRLTDTDGVTAFGAKALRIVLRPFGPTPFVDRIEVAAGEFTWDEERWAAVPASDTPPPAWIDDERAWPEVRISDLDVTAHLGRQRNQRLGRVHVRLVQTENGPKVDGAWLPPAGDSPVAVVGRVPHGAPIELRATAFGLDPQALPGVLRATIAEWKPRGRADLDVTMRIPRSGDVRPIVDARLCIVDGGLALPDGTIELDHVRVDVEGSYDPEVEPSFAVDATASATWNDATIEVALVAGRAAGPGRWLHGALRANGVEANEATLTALPLNGIIEPLYPALEPTGHANGAVDVVFESLDREPTFLIAIESTDDVSAAWHGFISSTSGERVGFPMRVDSATGRVLIADHPNCDRRTRVALVDIRGTAANLEGPHPARIVGEGLIVSPPRGTVPNLPELDLWFHGDGLTADDNAAAGLAGLNADWIWEDFRPAGGDLSATARIVLRRGVIDPAVVVDVQGRDVGFRWNRIPLSVTSDHVNVSLFFDGRGGLGLETATIGSTATVEAVNVAASVRVDPAERTRGRDETQAVTSAFFVRADNVPLRGDDAEILFASFEEIDAALQTIDAKGKADVTVELVQPLPGGAMNLSVDLTPRQLEVTPTQFPVTTRQVRGRVLTLGQLSNPFAADDDDAGSAEIRIAPLLGEWAGGARVAMTGTISHDGSARYDFLGAGLRPADRNFAAAVSRAAGSSDRGSSGTQSIELDGRVDGSGTLMIAADGTTTANFETLLRGNELRIAGEEVPLLTSMVGTVEATEAGLSCPRLDAILGRTPVRLDATTLEPMPGGGIRIETEVSADDLPLDRDHLRWFMDRETLDNLLDDLDWRGSIDVEAAELDFEQRPAGDTHVRFRGRTVLSDVFLRVGLPVSIRSGYADIEKLIFEDGRVRAWARMHDLYARIAGRNLDAAAMLVTYHAPRLNFLTLDGWFAGGRVHGLRTESSRTGPVISLDLTEPFRFELGASLVEVEIREILRDIFDSAIASDGLLTADLRLAGNLENLMAMRGSGSGRVEKARLWSLPVVRVILSALGAQNTVVFDEVYSRFQIEDGRITMSDIRVMSPLLQLIGFGTLDLDGRIDYELQVRYGLIDRLGPLTRLIYWIQNNLISIAVRGDMSRPRVRFLGLLGIASFGSDDPPERELPLPLVSPLPERF